jgi:hypothetical protein
MAASHSFLESAFFAQGNLLALGAAAAISAVLQVVTGTGALPLLAAAAGGELLYLGIVPHLPGFRRAVRARLSSERRATEQQELERMLEEMSPSQRECYFGLRALRDQVLENYRRIPAGGALADSSVDRIDAMLVSFVRLLASLNDYRRYLNNTDRQPLEKELAELRGELSGADSGTPGLKEIKERRVAILEKRLERFDKAADGRELISHQLASIEDFLRLLHEQSITLRDPETVGAQLDQLSMQIQATDDTVREMEKLLAVTDELAPAALPERQHAD